MTAMAAMKKVSWSQVILHLLLTTVEVSSMFACETTEDCIDQLITPGVSVCENNTCTNPYEQGCLKAMGDSYGKKNLTRLKNVFEEIRICNSDDYIIDDENTTDSTNLASCRQPEWKEFFEIGEIRIANSPWTSAFIFSYMIQIILTELLEVPTTTENGIDHEKGYGSFYDREDTPFYYPWYGYYEVELDALIEASRVDGNCELTDKPCAHVIPDASPFDR